MIASRKLRLLVISITLLYAFEGLAQSTNPVLDRRTALKNARSVDTQPIISQLTLPGALADGYSTVEQLKALSSRPDWPLPARELAIYQFTRSLWSLPRQAVDPAILEFLTTFQAQVLVAGEDHKREQLPLFNIRAAATGIENHWTRIDSAQLAAKVINSDPSEFLMLIPSAQSPSARAGFLDALRQARDIDIQAIGDLALQLLPAAPELSDVVAEAVQANPHGDITSGWLLHGRGPRIATTMRALGKQLNRNELAGLLQLAVDNASAENAALAIASWWPELSTDPAVRQLLLNTLADPELGSAAALALADKPNIQTIHELQQLTEGDSLAAKRARNALDFNRKELLREQQQ